MNKLDLPSLLNMALLALLVGGATYNPNGRNPVTPGAGTTSIIATGGTAVTVMSGPCNGGWVTNPLNAAAQGIATAENAYLDMVGSPASTDAGGNGTAQILVSGQSFFIPALNAGVSVKVNAATINHKFTVIAFQ
jgi:hypothetical protein